ncbi:MAG: hypothetical protein V3T30_01950, partial [Thermodesulfobacteriota bacterium]
KQLLRKRLQLGKRNRLTPIADKRKGLAGFTSKPFLYWLSPYNLKEFGISIYSKYPTGLSKVYL